MNARDFSLKCRQIVYCVTTAYAGKSLVTQCAKSVIMYSTATSLARNVVRAKYNIIVVA